MREGEREIEIWRDGGREKERERGRQAESERVRKREVRERCVHACMRACVRACVPGAAGRPWTHARSAASESLAMSLISF